jgi:hypothetical protein
LPRPCSAGPHRVRFLGYTGQVEGGPATRSALPLVTPSGLRVCIAARANVQFARAQPTTLAVRGNRYAIRLLDHLIGGGQQRFRDGQAECRCQQVTKLELVINLKTARRDLAPESRSCSKKDLGGFCPGRIPSKTIDNVGTCNLPRLLQLRLKIGKGWRLIECFCLPKAVKFDEGYTLRSFPY